MGSRNVLLAGALLTIISWILLALAKSVTTLIIGRIVAGIGDGVSLPCISIYICEIASKDIRGRLGAIPPLIAVFGNVFVLGAGPFLEYRTLIVSCAVFPVTFTILFWFMPNSPYFLMKNNKRKDAELNLMRLLGARDPAEVQNELREINEAIEHETGSLTLVQIMCSPNFRKSLLIAFGKVHYITLQEIYRIILVAQNISSFCGMHVIVSYLQIILASSGISMSKELTSVVFGLVQIPAVILYGVFMDKFGRKPTFFASALGASIALISEGVYIYLAETVDLTNVTFVPVLCIISYQFFISLGMVCLPHFIVGELFTIETKKVASSILMLYSSIIIFTNVKVIGGKVDSWSLHIIFWVYGGVCLLGVFFALFMLPETKGKSFTEIQSGISSHNRSSPRM
ncbi:facilitated trehalose transporter Tret1-like [Photinus pyralis]|uniref:facilitated trehalose transporter Tret1-like n=1 Tax=Photinus pyralis TaxID=7054 RepID=UPI001267811D|nr:facilitated trehalose transporter Tret1-like [Photinus pyralis]